VSAAPLQLREPEDARPSPASVPAPGAEGLPAQVGRYVVLEEIAHGGMGAVFKVRDTELGRTLAMKVLLDGHRERPDLARRFLEEAQIGGQLQHPGLVPVHELGSLPDQRPFFTMKLVKGRTLAELLRERASPADDLPRFLTIFEQVCQTLAYTHSRGVIHRDLKPANVMVGAFGEVQVMDWGLAKLLGQEPTTGEAPAGVVAASTLYTGRTAGEEDSATRAGTVLGTPAYMPPEQARGQVNHLDERCDVFGLGAILCEILTGLPPYRGSREQVMALASQGDLADARGRLERCGADPELAKLALRCLAFQPLERPANAGAVAESVTAYRAGVEQRARQAELERAAAQARVGEERKRRRLVVVLAVVVLLALAGGGGLWLRQEQKRLGLEHEAGAALDKAALFQQEGRWADALAQAHRAADLLPAIGDPPDLRQRVEDRIAEIELVQTFDSIRDTAGYRPQRVRTRFGEDAMYGKAFRDFGIDVDSLEPSEAAKRVAARPALKPYLIAALDDWVVPRKEARPDEPAGWKHLLAVARAADPDPWRDRLREAVVRDDLPALKQMAAAPDLEAPASTLLMLVAWLWYSREEEAAIALMRRVQWQHPADFQTTLGLGFMLGELYNGNSHQEESLRCCATAVALRPESGWAWNNYGIALHMVGRLDDAIAAGERAIRLGPKHPFPHLSLASCLRMKGNIDGMHRQLQLAEEIGRQLVERDPHDLDAWDGLRQALEQQGKTAEAFEVGLKRAKLTPDPAERSLRVGQAFNDVGRNAEALPHFTEALRLNPRLGSAARELGFTFGNLGQLDLGVAWTRKAIALPNSDLPMSYNNLAWTLLEKGESLDEIDQAIAKALSLQPLQDISVLTLAEVRRAQGRFADSLDAYRRGHELHRKRNLIKWPTEQWIKDAERLVELDRRWPAVHMGERKPADAAEYAAFGQLCVYKRLYAASALFYQQAFDLDAKLADDLGAGHRYQSARAAALAGCGHDAENNQLDDAARSRWRQKARDWLIADLALRKKQLETGKPEERTAVLYALHHWKTHNDLTGVRDTELRSRLPKEEQAEWQKLWSEVESLLNRARSSAR
jgi:serine/threonine-protein kinase